MADKHAKAIVKDLVDRSTDDEKIVYSVQFVDTDLGRYRVEANLEKPDGTDY